MPTSALNEQTIRNVFSQIKDPETGRRLSVDEQVRNIRIEGNNVRLELALPTFMAAVWKDVNQQAERQLRSVLPQLESVQIDVAPYDRPAEKLGKLGLPIKCVIAVGSGKGGVGKSTIAAALALALQRTGGKVGLLDADVYGPSIPHLFGLQDRPEVCEKRLRPVVYNGIEVMSMGLLVPREEAVIWRGPMLHGAITQFLRDTDWGPLDWLIVDMPPGTGDVALSLSQLIPISGAVVVCTPQTLALLDAVKAIAMFRKVDIPVVGMVENMSGFICPDCGKFHDIFGKGGAREKAEELDIPFLGEVPLNIAIRARGDASRLAEAMDDPATAEPLEQLAYRLTRNLADRRLASPVMPNLTVL